MLFEKMMLWWWWIVSTMRSASNWLRYGRRRKVCSQFPINTLPGPAISAIIDRLSIHQLRTLQRVNRTFRRTVNGRWLMPRRIGRVSIGVDHLHDDGDQTGDDEQIWTGELYINIMDMDGGDMCALTQLWQLSFWDHDGDDAVKEIFSLSEAAIRRFVHFFTTSSICAAELVPSAGTGAPVDSDRRFIDAAPLFRSFRAVSRLDMWPLSNSFLRNFQANYRCGAFGLCIRELDRDMKDMLRCQRCREDPWTENIWSCASCTSMWNGEWLSGDDGSGGGGFVHLFSQRPHDSRDFLRMVELAFAPARPQQRGMSFVLTAKKVFDNPTDPQPINVYRFLKHFERRIVTIYNGTMDVVDEMTDGAIILNEWMERRGYAAENIQFQACFEIHAANKNFVGGIICGYHDPTAIEIVFLDQ